MNKRVTIQLAVFLKSRFSRGLLCCLVLVGAYLLQNFLSGMYVDAFSSSHYLFMWLILFVGVLLWTFREEGTHGLPSEVIDWQCIAAFLLIVSNQVYTIMPKEVHVELAPVLSTYTLPLLIILGFGIVGGIKLMVSLSKLLKNEQQKRKEQERQLQELLSSPPSVLEGVESVRKLLENESISQLGATEYLVLIEGCRAIDPDFFVWLKNIQHTIPPRDIVYCILIRMRKTKKEISAILGVEGGTYRTMRSRLRVRLGVEDEDFDTFLQRLN